MTNTKKIDRTAQYNEFAASVTADFPPTQTWVLANATYKRDDLVSLAQGCVASLKTSATTHAAWIAATTDSDAKVKAFAPVLAGFKRILEGQYGETSPALARYGYAPGKPRTQTAESKAAAAAKGRATRAAKKAALAAVATAPAAGKAAPATGAAGATAVAGAPAAGTTRS
ncbi:MAG TPA: hypothetical protein VIF09_26590 [Polyangiaceae bacterium]|jgi:hypothetical protein